MRYIKILLILPILIYGGLKGYVWYEVKTTMDDIIATAAPFADITYDSVISSLEGTVGVGGVVIRPKMASDEFTIQEMTISAPNILDIIFIGRNAKNKEFPEYAALEFKKVGIDLNSKIFAMLGNMQAQAAMQQPQSAPLLVERIDALGCGDVVRFGRKEFIDMGYNPLELDVTFNMEFRKVAREMKINMSFKDRDLYDLRLAMQFPFDSDKIKSGAAASEQEISRLNIKYIDTGYHKLRNQYCARINKGTVDEYVDANISLLTAQLGAVLPEKTAESYRNFLINGGTVNVSMNPVEPAMLSGLSLYKNSDVMDILGMDITINGDTIDNKLIVWNENQFTEDKAEETNASTEKQELNPVAAKPSTSPSPAPAPVLASASANVSTPVSAPESVPADVSTPVSAPESVPAKAKVSVPAPVLAKTSAPAKPVPKKYDYRTVKKTQLSKYVGRKIKVETSTGKSHDGLLESAASDRVWIKMRMRGGEFSFPIKLVDVTDIKVYLYR